MTAGTEETPDSPSKNYGRKKITPKPGAGPSKNYGEPSKNYGKLPFFRA